MISVLVTGATGNVGKNLISHLLRCKNLSISAGVRNINKKNELFEDRVVLREFDFENSKTFRLAFLKVDILFLLRPPHISDVNKYFKPILISAKINGVKKIVFLSVQGAEKSSIIPHHKIESLIKQLHFEYIFIRPGYFMQNLTTTLHQEIKNNKTITLPASDAKFNWIDVNDIGNVTAKLIKDFEKYKNRAFEITGNENKNFEEITKVLNNTLEINIVYKSINPLSFFIRKKKEGLSTGLAIVMLVLHFLPRFEKEPNISNDYKQITGLNPTSLETFFLREKKFFID